MAKILKKPTVLFTFWLLLITIIVSWPFISAGKVPIASDILLGHYHPWVDAYRTSPYTTYPIKNFLLFDGIRQTLPWRLLAIDLLKQGQWPLWNPYNLLGTPLLANIQTAALYPLNFIFWLTSSLDAWSIYILIQPFLTSLGMWFFLRSEKLNAWAVAIASVGLGLSGIMANHLTFGIDGHTFLWLPWAMYAVNKIFNEKIIFAPLLSVFICLSFLAGYLPPAVYGLGIILFWSLYKTYEAPTDLRPGHFLPALRREQNPSEAEISSHSSPNLRPRFSAEGDKTKNIRLLMLTLIALTIGLGISAIQLLPSIDLSNKTVRADKWFGPESGEPFYWPVKHALMILAPDYFGHPSTGNFYTNTQYTDNPYIGAVGLVGVVFAFFSKRKDKIFPLTLLVLALIYAFPTPISQLIRSLNIKFLSEVASMRIIWIVAFLLSWVSAIGLDSILTKKLNMNKLAKSAILISSLYSLAWFLTTILPPANYTPTAQKNIIIPTALAIGTVVAAYVYKKFKLFPIWLIGLGLLILSTAELTRETIKYTPFVNKDFVFAPTKIIDRIQEDSSTFRTIITQPDVFPANSNIAYRIPMLDGYYSMRTQQTEQFLSLVYASEELEQLGSFPRIITINSPQKQLADLMGVKYIISKGPITDTNIMQKTKFLFAERDAHLYENKFVFPKIFFASSWELVQDRVTLARQMLTSDISKTVFVGEDLSIPNSLNIENAAVSINTYDPGNISFSYSNPDQGLLLINDSYDNGWTAYIDDKPAEVIQADFNLIAIAAPAGEHSARLFYYPKQFNMGFKISAISLAILLFFSAKSISLHKKLK